MEINGKPVIDATEPLHISISAQDAQKGRTKDPGSCAAARCIVRTIADAEAARVHLGRTYVDMGDYWLRYKTPMALKVEIVSFDRGATKVHAVGDYTLGAPSPTDKLEARKKYSVKERKNHKRRPHIARIHHHIEGVRARGANR